MLFTQNGCLRTQNLMPMKPYFKENHRGMPCDILPRVQKCIFLWSLLYHRIIEVHMVSFSRALCRQVSLNWVLIVIYIHYTTPTLCIAHIYSPQPESVTQGLQGVYMCYTPRRMVQHIHICICYITYGPECCIGFIWPSPRAIGPRVRWYKFNTEWVHMI